MINFENLSTNNYIVKSKNSLQIYATSYGFDETNTDKHIRTKCLEYSIHFIVSGSGYICYDGYNKVKVNSGDIFFLLPYEKKISYFANEENPWSYCWINFMGNFNQIFKKLGVSFEKPFFHYNNTKKIEDIFLNLYSSLKNYPSLSNFICNATISELIYTLLQTISPIIEEKDYSSHIEKAQKYIETNYSNPELSVSKVAEQLALNTAYFSRLFKSSTGVNFSSYVMEYRIMQASSLIYQGLYSVKEISYAVGFVSPHYFSDQFMKIHKIRPKEYIKQVKEKNSKKSK